MRRDSGIPASNEIYGKRQPERDNMDRKLALRDEILMSVEKPARYIGGEFNSVMKDPDSVAVRFAFCFPDVYPDLV